MSKTLSVVHGCSVRSDRWSVLGDCAHRSQRATPRLPLFSVLGLSAVERQLSTSTCTFVLLFVAGLNTVSRSRGQVRSRNIFLFDLRRHPTPRISLLGRIGFGPRLTAQFVTQLPVRPTERSGNTPRAGASLPSMRRLTVALFLVTASVLVDATSKRHHHHRGHHEHGFLHVDSAPEHPMCHAERHVHDWSIVRTSSETQPLVTQIDHYLARKELMQLHRSVAHHPLLEHTRSMGDAAHGIKGFTYYWNDQGRHLHANKLSFATALIDKLRDSRANYFSLHAVIVQPNSTDSGDSAVKFHWNDDLVWKEHYPSTIVLPHTSSIFYLNVPENTTGGETDVYEWSNDNFKSELTTPGSTASGAPEATVLPQLNRVAILRGDSGQRVRPCVSEHRRVAEPQQSALEFFSSRLVALVFQQYRIEPERLSNLHAFYVETGLEHEAASSSAFLLKQKQEEVMELEEMLQKEEDTADSLEERVLEAETKLANALKRAKRRERFFKRKVQGLKKDIKRLRLDDVQVQAKDSPWSFFRLI
eukprot:TRINITY_DN9072_c0_g1_i1.p1 TRINITY_DN9072_c0_g1~~TRINITY_DN9072_c0_g1_i1.p1  ORF type:complete len:531 (+),score=59.96 TRINITY_DN9072_c0_g1_i1:373-1965(+)